MHDWLVQFYGITDPILLIYFSIINFFYTIFFILGAIGTFKRMKEVQREDFTRILQSNNMPEITFIVPTYNDETIIFSCVENLLHLNYPYKQIIVVNDGSEDNTLQVLFEKLKLSPIPIFFHSELPSKPIRGIYKSNLYPNIIVIDKENGEKYDALNAAINACQTTYFTVMDSDTYIEDKEFEALIRPIFASPNTIALGAAVKIKNGCDTLWNRVDTSKFPKDYIAAIQAIEYQRAFLMRSGWDYIGETYILSGAFGVFTKDVIVQIGGYGPTIANDLEIILRLNRVMKATKTSFQIVYLPDPVAWTEGPASWRALKEQRIRWQRGTLESLWFNKSVLFNPKYGLHGMFVHPFLWFFEAFEPLVEIFGYFYILIGWIFGIINPFFVFSFIALTVGFVFIQTLGSLLIEEFSFRKFTSMKTLFVLFAYSLFESLGYRQLTLIWRAKGFASFFKRYREIQKNSKKLNAKINQVVRNGKIKW
jgi:cellulose synthase/poly-beta-1,6-N-acetylglucosamine synthase-like glycosyltransferase